MKEKLLLTKKGLIKLQSEYDELLNVQRPAVVDELKRSRDLGDLSENGAYSAAREKQSFVEGRINELENILKNVVIADREDNGFVEIGSIVTLDFKGVKIKYEIVGHGETDIEKKRISNDSPLGEALIGKRVGNVVLVDAPVGKVEYIIVAIE